MQETEKVTDVTETCGGRLLGVNPSDSLEGFSISGAMSTGMTELETYLHDYMNEGPGKSLKELSKQYGPEDSTKLGDYMDGK